MEEAGGVVSGEEFKIMSNSLLTLHVPLRRLCNSRSVPNPAMEKSPNNSAGIVGRGGRPTLGKLVDAVLGVGRLYNGGGSRLRVKSRRSSGGLEVVCSAVDEDTCGIFDTAV